MYNHFMLLGRVAKDPEVKELEDGRKVLNISLAVRKNFKNIDGEYDVEFYRISFWEFLVEQYSPYLSKGMSIFVKGRLLNVTEKLMTGYELVYPSLIGEKILYFTPPKNNELFAESE